MQSRDCKIQVFSIFSKDYLHISKKSCTFALQFENGALLTIKTITIMDTYEVVKEFIDEEGNVNDFVVLDFCPKDYDDALAFAEKQEISNGEQISIWLSDDEGNVLDSWIIK